jgi:inner membrane protein
MATVAHLVVGALISSALAPPRRHAQPMRLATGALLAIAPDLDFAGSLMRDSAPRWLSHRGASHSVAVGLSVGGLAGLGVRALGRSDAWQVSAMTAACVASHGVVDLFTETDVGVALMWPLSEARMRSPLRPVISPPLRRLADLGGWARAVGSELLVLGTVLAAVWARAGWARRRK